MLSLQWVVLSLQWLCVVITVARCCHYSGTVEILWTASHTSVRGCFHNGKRVSLNWVGTAITVGD